MCCCCRVKPQTQKSPIWRTRWGISVLELEQLLQCGNETLGGPSNAFHFSLERRCSFLPLLEQDSVVLQIARARASPERAVDKDDRRHSQLLSFPPLSFPHFPGAGIDMRLAASGCYAGARREGAKGNPRSNSGGDAGLLRDEIKARDRGLSS